MATQDMIDAGTKAIAQVAKKCAGSCYAEGDAFEFNDYHWPILATAVLDAVEKMVHERAGVPAPKYAGIVQTLRHLTKKPTSIEQNQPLLDLLIETANSIEELCEHLLTAVRERDNAERGLRECSNDLQNACNLFATAVSERDAAENVLAHVRDAGMDSKGIKIFIDRCLAMLQAYDGPGGESRDNPRRMPEHPRDLIAACAGIIAELSNGLAGAINARNDARATVQELRLVCAEAYQLAGVYDAPEAAKDNLSDAANGHPLRHKTFLPVFPPIMDRDLANRAMDIVCILANTPPREWHSKQIIHESLAPFRTRREHDVETAETPARG